MFKNIFKAIVSTFSALGAAMAQEVRGAWEMTIVNGRRVWNFVQPAVRVTRRAAVALQPAAELAVDVATLPIRIVGAAFSGAPSAAVTQSHEDAAIAKAEKAAANFRDIEIAEPPRMKTAAECARQQAQSILDPSVNSPYVGHLSERERTWIWGIDTRQRALPVSSALDEDLALHMSGELPNLRFHRMPSKVEARKVQASYDAYVATQPRHVFTSSLSDELLAEIEANVGRMNGPR